MDYKAVRIIDKVYENGKESSLSGPTGLLADKNYVYIADTGNSRVIMVDGNNNVLLTLKKPDDPLFDQKRFFQPQKILRDKNGYFYVLSLGTYEGALLYNPDGKAIERSCYEYIRDFLGYHIAAKNAEISKAGRFTEIKLKLINYGFSAPHSMKSCDIVLLDKDNNIIAARPACKLSELQSGNEVTCETSFDGDISAAVRFGFSLKDYGNKGARLANDCEFINGVNILGELEI